MPAELPSCLLLTQILIFRRMAYQRTASQHMLVVCINDYKNRSRRWRTNLKYQWITNAYLASEVQDLQL